MHLREVELAAVSLRNYVIVLETLSIAFNLISLILLGSLLSAGFPATFKFRGTWAEDGLNDVVLMLD